MTEPRSLIPDSHLAATGHVANMIATLELQIDLGIWELVGAPQQLIACVTGQFVSVHPRLNAFIGLAELLGASDDTLKALRAFHGEMGGLAEKRNRLVHDPRMMNQRTGKVGRLQITAKPKPHFGFISETDEEVNDVGNQIGAKISEFVALRDKVISELSPLREKSLSQLKGIAPHPAA